MRVSSILLVLAAGLGITSARLVEEAKLGIRLIQPLKGELAFEVTGLSPDVLQAIAKAGWKTDDWNACFAVYVENASHKDRLPMLGTYSVTKTTVRFEPRFGLIDGKPYFAEFDPTKLPNYAGTVRAVVRQELSIPKVERKADTTVAAVYPSSDTLPENQLKFYIHFSAPMSRGEAYDRIHMLDDKGQEIKFAFLEVGEELWDPECTRFTLFIDPGRIKRGLKPREDLGPVLEAGRSYSLVIDRAWNDANGVPLKEPFKKEFKVAKPAEQPIDPKNWQLSPPAAGKLEALRVEFPAPLDHALLLRLPFVQADDGRRVPGKITISLNETVWQFTPESPWLAGKYDLVVPRYLEDLAGNQIGRPFEVDSTKPDPKDLKKNAKIGFRIK